MTEILRDEYGEAMVFREGASGRINLTLRDETNTVFDANDCSSIILDLVDSAGAAINSRVDLDVKDANIGTVESDGTLTIRLQPADNAISGSLDIGEAEVHYIIIAFVWNDGVESRTGREMYAFKVQNLPV